MPVPNQIATAVQSFNRNDSFLKQGIDVIPDEDWVRRPSEHANHLLWIVAHMTWARGALLGRLGSPWATTWMPLYARGAKCVDSSDGPSPSEVMQAWDESCARLNAAFESVTEDALNAPNGRPSPDGKVSGLVDFLAFHETYHLGQASYVRSLLGHPGVMG